LDLGYAYFRELRAPETEFPRRPLLGSSVNNGKEKGRGLLEGPRPEMKPLPALAYSSQA
jgi:hypothetical protein